jgi:hypothetical protein
MFHRRLQCAAAEHFIFRKLFSASIGSFFGTSDREVYLLIFAAMNHVAYVTLAPGAGNPHSVRTGRVCARIAAVGIVKITKAIYVAHSSLSAEYGLDVNFIFKLRAIAVYISNTAVESPVGKRRCKHENNQNRAQDKISGKHFFPPRFRISLLKKQTTFQITNNVTFTSMRLPALAELAQSKILLPGGVEILEFGIRMPSFYIVKIADLMNFKRKTTFIDLFLKISRMLLHRL